MVRILHAGDFHLDSAFGALTPEQARQRRAESRRMPERMVDWANDHGVQLLLLAGDLGDSSLPLLRLGEQGRTRHIIHGQKRFTKPSLHRLHGGPPS